MDFATKRLTAKKLSSEHLDDLIGLHLDPEVSRYLGGVRSPEQTAAYLDANLLHWAEHGFGLWLIRTLDGEFVGRAGIRRIIVEDTPEVEIAYALKRANWGQGFATEIAAALVDVWRTRLTSPSLIGIASPANTASRRVIAKSGLVYERQATYRGEDVVLYRLMR